MYKVNVNNVLVLAFSNQYDCVRFQQLVCGCKDLVFRDYNDRTDYSLPEIDMVSYPSEYDKLAIFWKEFSHYFTVRAERVKKAEIITPTKGGSIPIYVKPFYSYAISYSLEEQPSACEKITHPRTLFDIKIINTSRKIAYNTDLDQIRKAIMEEEHISDLEYNLYILRIDATYSGNIPDVSLEVEFQ